MASPPDTVTSYRMLGRTVRVEFDGSRGAELLREELSRYPIADREAAPELTVRYRPVEETGRRFLNPRTHCELGDGFVLKERVAEVRFDLDGDRLRSVDFYPTSPGAAVMAHARRLLDVQFTSREERAGVIFHELVAVPSAYWMPDLAVVHASAFSDPAGRVTLVGGTGGVGKTSLALELCTKHGYQFLADDISLVDRSGHVWPNLAYPKIYAYNLEGNAEVAERVLAGRSVADRIHWSLHRRRGLQFVRRRIAPDVLYGSYDGIGGPLERYVILAREDRPDIEVCELSPARAAEMSVSLMPPEYYPFHNHLYWHAFHRALEGRNPSVTVRQAIDRWKVLLRQVFEGAICLLVRIPTTVEHDTFKHQAAELLTQPT